LGLFRQSRYLHVLQAGRELLTYSKYIFTEFDNRRITTIGQKTNISNPKK